jgi:hypothetical protein
MNRRAWDRRTTICDVNEVSRYGIYIADVAWSRRQTGNIKGDILGINL